MSIEFEKEVLTKLSLIEDRLSSIEEKFDEATSFADSVLSDENSVLGMDGLNSIKETLSAFLPLQTNSNEGDVQQDGGAEGMQDLVGSLKDFRDRLTGIKSAIANLPVEPSNTLDNDEDDEVF